MWLTDCWNTPVIISTCDAHCLCRYLRKPWILELASNFTPHTYLTSLFLEQGHTKSDSGLYRFLWIWFTWGINPSEWIHQNESIWMNASEWIHQNESIGIWIWIHRNESIGMNTLAFLIRSRIDFTSWFNPSTQRWSGFSANTRH